MMGVGAKRAIGLYRSCAPRHPGVSKIQTECHPRSRLPVLSKNTNELSFSYAATSVKLDGSCDGVSSCSVLGHLRFVNVLGFVSMARG